MNGARHPAGLFHPLVSHHPENPEAERRAMKLRLHRVIGQLKAIDGMLDRDCDCAEILHQLIAARRALKSLSEKIIHDHLQHCVTELGREDDGRRTLREMATLLKRYIE
ncbi:MAG TPA: metal-sensitive transcriptional regulator [Opitutaceae bacterium]|nr:metal-sensitive transcriptional regulator [Opitutaceae bacterium]